MNWMMPAKIVFRTALMFGAFALAACGGSSNTGSAGPAGAAGSSGGGPPVSAAGDPLLFSSSNYSIAQGTASVSLTVLRVGTPSAAVSVDYATVDGTAIAGTDYTATSGTLQWAANDSSAKTIVVPIGGATPFSGNRSFTVALSDPSATAEIASPDSAVVTISGNAGSASTSLQFSTATYAVAQSSKQLAVTVTRTTASGGSTSVDYVMSNGTAVAGTDFTASNGTLTWAAGDGASKTILVPISAAAAFSGTRSFAIALTNPTSGAVLGSPSSATVAITGAASAAMGTLHLSAATYTVTQGAGAFTVVVNRTGGTNGEVSVAYSTTSGSAVAGKDFTAAAGTLTWANGDSTAKSFPCAVSSATPFSGSKAFTVALSSPTNGATISSPSKATVTISGDASPAVGSVKLGASSYTVAPNSNATSMTVDRTGGSSGAVSVTYATSNGTAKAGTDFTAANGTLDWADGDTTPKTFSIPIDRATQFTGSKTFAVVLSAPSGGAAVSTPNSANVIITGSSSGGSGAPSAPSSLLMTGQAAGSISLAWGAATSGSGSISHYKIYRNGSAYATSNSNSYTDNGAANATNGAWNSAATIYAYSVSAVDSQGTEGPQTTQSTFNVYTNGVFNWGGDYSYGVSINYRDTSGGPESGPYDIAVDVAQSYGGFQPYSGNVVTQWDLETGSFGYISLDLKPTMNNQSWRLSMISRLPPGDVYPWSAVNIGDYGPAPVPGKWATYKIPLSALSMGKTSFEGSISGSTLTVTNVNSGVGVDAGGFISGNGVRPGTYIVGHNANGGPGTYTISPSQSVSSTAMTEQRTGLYKFDIVDESGASNNRYYIDNVKFTTQ